jgi:hypothetical protein
MSIKSTLMAIALVGAMIAPVACLARMAEPRGPGARPLVQGIRKRAPPPEIIADRAPLRLRRLPPTLHERHPRLDQCYRPRPLKTEA